MSVSALKTKFDLLLKGLGGTPGTRFSTTVESAYEALVLADVMQEYARVNGGIKMMTAPSAGSFLNQAPARFRKETSFKIDFNSGRSFYFAADVELFGLVARAKNAPDGMLFEADVVVIFADAADDIINNFNGYPAPQHLDFLLECKFGKYYKGQLRELLGLRRHVSFLTGRLSAAGHSGALYGNLVQNCTPEIAVKIARPLGLAFVDAETAALYDLQQLVIS